MKLFTSLVALLSLASLVVPSSTADQRLSSCKASDRVLVSTRNVTAAGHEFQVSTKACSADVLNSRAIEKRQVFDVCNNGETQNFECVAGGVGPTFTDCDNLSAAIEAAFEQPGDPTLFVVDPQFAQEFSLGTCLWAFINDNPVGGAILEFCYVEVSIGLGAILTQDCIRNGFTSGIAFPSGVNFVPAALDWTFEVTLA